MKCSVRGCEGERMAVADGLCLSCARELVMMRGKMYEVLSEITQLKRDGFGMSQQEARAYAKTFIQAAKGTNAPLSISTMSMAECKNVIMRFEQITRRPIAA